MRSRSGRRTPRLMAALVTAALVAAACSGDDGAREPAGAGTPTDSVADDGTGDGGAVVQAGDPASVVLADVDASGEALFPCGASAGSGTVSITYVQFLPVELVGPTAEAFRAAVGDHNLRCGGQLQVAVGYAEEGDGTDVCSLPTLETTVVVVTDAAGDAAADCLAGDDRLLWHEGGATDAAAVGTFAPPIQRAADSVAVALAEGVVGERRVVVVHDGTPRRVAAAERGVLSVFEDAAIAVDTVEAPCDGSTLGLDVAGAFVITLLPPACLADLTREAAADGADVRWLVIGDGLSLAPVDGVAYDAATFDSALAYEFAPAVTAGLPRDRAPVARDRACVEYLDGFTGHQTEFPSAAFAAHTRLCATLAGLFGALDRAGGDSAPETISAAVAEVAGDVVLPQGQPGAGGAGPWLAPGWVTTVEWNADCACWTYVRGPDPAPVD